MARCPAVLCTLQTSPSEVHASLSDVLILMECGEKHMDEFCRTLTIVVCARKPPWARVRVCIALLIHIIHIRSNSRNKQRTWPLHSGARPSHEFTTRQDCPSCTMIKSGFPRTPQGLRQLFEGDCPEGLTTAMLDKKCER